MKNITKVIAVTAVAIGFANSSFAQATATASASATIISPVSIAKNVDMAFGNVAVSASSGTVVLDPSSTRTPTGGVTLPSTTGTVSAADFTVSGTPAYTYAITLPSSAILTDATTDVMTVDGFTSNPSATGVLSVGGGTQDLTVGATLHVGATQASGTYSNATGVPVTVNYN